MEMLYDTPGDCRPKRGNVSRASEDIMVKEHENAYGRMCGMIRHHCRWTICVMRSRRSRQWYS